jgi:hypothetical protein
VRAAVIVALPFLPALAAFLSAFLPYLGIFRVTSVDVPSGT